jgi:hypothetical protein
MAGMQPYFFPYLGYWQLIDAVDCFVLFDEAQYIKQGWVNRNRILKPGGGWQYIQVPVVKHPISAPIHDVEIVADGKWRSRILNQLRHYKKTAPFFSETAAIVEALLMSAGELLIGALNCRIIHELCALLCIDTQIIVSSSHHFDYSEVEETRDWAFAHAVHLGATELINPSGGFNLLDMNKFQSRGIGLSVFESLAIVYPQSGATFEPALSIIDVLMYNGIVSTRGFLAQRKILRRLEPALG